MGQSVVFACPKNWDLARFAPILEDIARAQLATFVNFGAQLQLDSQDRGWTLTVREIVDKKLFIDGYVDNDLHDEAFREEVPNLRFFSVRFNNFDVARQLVYAFAKKVTSCEQSAWIDTDYGWVVSAAEVVTEIDGDARWDWRREKTT
jgi:hypothetical protein